MQQTDLPVPMHMCLASTLHANFAREVVMDLLLTVLAGNVGYEEVEQATLAFLNELTGVGRAVKAAEGFAIGSIFPTASAATISMHATCQLGLDKTSMC